jgi:tetratricopeptide (TPR) repeat protein
MVLVIFESINLFAQTPQTAKDWFELGNKQSEQELYSEAIISFSECIKLDESSRTCFLNRGVAYFNLNQNTEAISDATEAIRLNPNRADAFNNRGTAYAKFQKYDEANADFAKARELEKDYKPAIDNQAKLDKVLANYDSIKKLTKAIAKDRTNANLYLQRGDLYKAIWDEQESEDRLVNIALATADYSKYISLKPNVVDAYRKRAMARRDLFFGVNPYTISDLQMVVKLDSADTQSKELLAKDSAEYQKFYQTEQCKNDRGTKGFQGTPSDPMMHPLDVYLDSEMTPDSDEFLKALACGANVNFKNKETNEPFFGNIVNMRFEHLIGILEAGAKVDVKDKKGNTPLMQILNQIIAGKNDLDNQLKHSISVILMYGANLNAKNLKRQTALSLARKAKYKFDF